MPQVERQKQQARALPWFWTLELQGEGVGGQAWFLSSLGLHRVMSISSHDDPSMHATLLFWGGGQISSSCKDLSGI